MGATGEIDAVTLARLRAAHPGIDEHLENDRTLKEAVRVIALASPFLTRLLLTDSQALDVLSDLETRRPPPSNSTDALVRWKRTEMLRIAARDLLAVDALEVVGANLARLGDDVLTTALLLAGAQDDLVIVGMGKLAGRELNYASDIDVMFVGDNGDKQARAVMDIARQCFRTDANLRPEGRDGPLVRSVESYKAYWEEWAATWEFQALLKSRTITGPTDVQEVWTAASEEALWSRQFGAEDLRDLRNLKARSEQLVSQKGLTERELKRGPGGIRDVEFAVQLLQLVHGRDDHSIRSATTLTALNELADGGYIAPDDAVGLGNAYRYLRTVEHRLQLVEEEQTHTVPRQRDERERLARVLGYSDDAKRSGLEQFEEELRTYQRQVRSAHERLYFRPLLEAFATGTVPPGSALEERLTAFGFREADRTRQAVQELTKGLTRSSNLMRQLMPLLLDWLSVAPNPDNGLLGLRKLIAVSHTPQRLVSLFRDSPEAARRLCLLLGTSPLFARSFSSHPELLDGLAHESVLVPTSPPLERINAALQWRTGAKTRQSALIRTGMTEQLRIAMADVVGALEELEGGYKRAELADAVIEAALQLVEPQVPVAVIALGRHGGKEMSYVSDMDIVVVHGGSGSSDQSEAERVAQALKALIDDPTPGRALYRVDYDLRPEGKNGALARSIEGCRDYYGSWAQTWERQALVRARVAAGDAEVGKDFMRVIEGFIWEQDMDGAALKEVRHLKARMESERMPRGEDVRYNLKLGKGSLSDVEWTVQLLQLQHCVPETNTLAALTRLQSENVLDPADAKVLEESWRFCDRARNRRFLVVGAPGDALPILAEPATSLARSLGLFPVEMREKYLQVTRRARTVMERLFYGQTPA